MSDEKDERPWTMDDGRRLYRPSSVVHRLVLSPITHHSSPPLKVEPQRELYLAFGAEADGAFDGLAQQAEGRAGGRLRVGLAGLERADGAVERRRRVDEVRPVEDVEDLRPELKPHALGERDALVEDEVGLPEAGAAQCVAREVAERFRARASRRRPGSGGCGHCRGKG